MLCDMLGAVRGVKRSGQYLRSLRCFDLGNYLMKTAMMVYQSRPAAIEATIQLGAWIQSVEMRGVCILDTYTGRFVGTLLVT